MPKRILIVSRYFWPDKTPESLILYSLAKFLVTKGYEVDVLSSLPFEKGNEKNIDQTRIEITKGVQIIRIKLSWEKGKSSLIRIKNSLKLAFKTLCLAFKNNYGIIISSSNPPVVGPFSCAISSLINRAKFIYYCMDVTPEVGTINGDFKNPLFYKILEIIDTLTCLVSNPIIVHSNDMRKTLKKRTFGSRFKFKILNNFSVKTNSNKNKEGLYKTNKNKLRIIYAGNMGRFQGLETAIKAMSLINKNKDIELIFIGEGLNKKNLIKLSNELQANVKFYPYLEPSLAKNFIKKADLGLISLTKNVYKFSYPSKTMTYLEQGKPIIAIVEEESNIAQDLISGSYGYVVPHEEDSLANLLIYLKKNSQEVSLKSLNAFKSYEDLFSERVVLKKWVAIIENDN